MEQLLKDLTAKITEAATITWDLRRDSVSFMYVDPIHKGPSPFSVAWSAHEVVIGFGRGSRVELGPGDEDLPLIVQMVRAIIDGRVVEVIWGRHSRAWVELDDGTVVGDGPRRAGIFTGRRSRTEVRYGPYARS